MNSITNQDELFTHEEPNNSNFKRILLIGAGIVALVAISVVAFNFYSSYQETQRLKASATPAIKALEKLGSATEVGLNKLKYADLLIEAKTAVNQAQKQLPDGELKNQLLAAMLCYEDAGAVWDEKENSQDGKNISEKYSGTFLFSFQLTKDLRNSLMSIIWMKAKLHTDKASELIGESSNTH